VSSFLISVVVIGFDPENLAVGAIHPGPAVWTSVDSEVTER